MARTYRRDSRGRFAGGGGGRTTGGSIGARSSARRSRQKLESMGADASAASRRAQKGAVTRTSNAAKAAQTANRRKIAARPGGTLSRSGRRPQPPAAANNVRRLQRQAPANAIQRFKRPPKNQPPPKKVIESLTLRTARRAARDLANFSRRDTTGKVAKFMVQKIHTPRDLMNARRVIAGRAMRAAKLAESGSKAGAKARSIYDRQLIPALPGSKGKGRNNLRPGPRNTQGPPKRKRRR